MKLHIILDENSSKRALRCAFESLCNKEKYEYIHEFVTHDNASKFVLEKCYDLLIKMPITSDYYASLLCLVRHHNLSTKILSKLANHTDNNIRYLVAKHHNTSIKTLIKLSKDNFPTINIHAKNNRINRILLLK